MKTIKIYPLPKPIQAEVTIPGSLSYTIRALNLAAMTQESVKIINPVKSDDSYAMVKILQTLGIDVEEGENYFQVNGSISDVVDKEYILDVNISGRTARTVLALLTVTPGTKVLICKEEFKNRPIADLVDGLRQLGASIEYLEQEGHLPVRIISDKLHSGIIKMKGNISSQYFSAIIMIAPLIGDVTIEVLGKQASKPFIDVTIDTMHDFGVEVVNENYQRYHIKTPQHYKSPGEYTVEVDAIAASYFWAIAALTQSKIKVLHLSPDSKQGDVHFADLLEQMGCKVKKNSKDCWIEVEGILLLNSIIVDMNHMPDTVPTLAVVAAFAKGITYITGLEHLKVKESDRLEAPKNELRKMEIQTKATTDSLDIEGGSPYGAVIDTYGDHRIAMAFAVAGSRIPGIEIQNPNVVNKSFPNFWKTLQKIGIQLEEITI